jgi:hypothetical protein
MPPVVIGAQNNVLIAETPSGQKVFKFGAPGLVEKNAAVSQLYNIRKIPVPHVTAHKVGGVCFEKSDKVSGITLFEAIQNGMSREKIKQVYEDILVEFDKMSHILPAYLNKNLICNVHDIAMLNVSNTNNSVLGKLCMALVYIMNIGHKQDLAIFHSDITPKNIIVSDDYKFKYFIDLDNVCVCNKNYAFSIMAAKYKELGFDVNELMNKYHQISHNRLPANKINRRVTLAAFVKRLLWQHANKKNRQK